MVYFYIFMSIRQICVDIFEKCAILHRKERDSMSDANICRFIPRHNDTDAIHTIHFVLETKPQPFTALSNPSIYKTCLAVWGNGTLHLPGASYPLSAGDLFFCLPGTPSAIESDGSLHYIYVSYIGTRANMLIDQLGVRAQNCVFHGFDALIPVWQQALALNTAVSDLSSESALLHALAMLGDRQLMHAKQAQRQDETVSKIQKYLDDHFAEPDLSLERIAHALGYNAKYISTLFKKHFQIGASEYLRILRIQHACTLMQQGFTSIKDIALLCGFEDSLHFSKVFKSKMSESPRSYIASLNENTGARD